MEMKKREDGFYWVREGSNWEVARWEGRYGGVWLFTGSDEGEPEVDEVDERKIERKE